MQHGFETGDPLQNGLHLLGDGGVAVHSRHNQRRRALGEKQVCYGLDAEKVVYRARDADDLGPEQRDGNLRKGRG